MDHHPLHLQVTLQEPLLLIHQELQDHLTQLDQLIPLPLLIPLLLLIPLALPLHTHHLLLILLEPQGRIKDHLTIKDLLTLLDLLLLTLQDHHQLIHQEQLTLQALLLLIRQDLTHHHLNQCGVCTLRCSSGLFPFQGGCAVCPLNTLFNHCLLYTSPSPRDLSTSRMPSSA